MLDGVVMLRVGLDKIFQDRTGDTFRRLAWTYFFAQPLLEDGIKPQTTNLISFYKLNLTKEVIKCLSECCSPSS